MTGTEPVWLVIFAGGVAPTDSACPPDDEDRGGAGRFSMRLLTTGARLATLCRGGVGVEGARCGRVGSGVSGWSFGTCRSGHEAAGSASAGRGIGAGVDVRRRRLAATGPRYPRARTASIAPEMYLPVRSRSAPMPSIRAAYPTCTFTPLRRKMTRTLRLPPGDTDRTIAGRQAPRLDRLRTVTRRAGGVPARSRSWCEPFRSRAPARRTP